MLPNQHEILPSYERGGIDQFGRLDSSGDAKEQIHDDHPATGAESRHSFMRNTKIREQPSRIQGRRASQFPHDPGQRRFRKAIQDEVRHHQVVVTLGWTPRLDVLMEKTNTIFAARYFTLDPLPRQLK